MKKIFVIFIALVFIGCNKSKDIKPHVLDIGMAFSVVNSQNEDLLNPSTDNHYKESEIKIFYIIDGERKEIYDPNMNNPRNFRIYKHENEYRLSLALNYTETSGKPITYIQWNSIDTDTIEAIYKRFGKTVRKQKVWMNSVEIWDSANNEEEYYKLIK